MQRRLSLRKKESSREKSSSKRKISIPLEGRKPVLYLAGKTGRKNLKRRK